MFLKTAQYSLLFVSIGMLRLNSCYRLQINTKGIDLNSLWPFHYSNTQVCYFCANVPGKRNWFAHRSFSLDCQIFPSHVCDAAVRNGKQSGLKHQLDPGRFVDVPPFLILDRRLAGVEFRKLGFQGTLFQASQCQRHWLKMGQVFRSFFSFFCHSEDILSGFASNSNKTHYLLLSLSQMKTWDRTLQSRHDKATGLRPIWIFFLSAPFLRLVGAQGRMLEVWANEHPFVSGSVDLFRHALFSQQAIAIFKAQNFNECCILISSFLLFSSTCGIALKPAESMLCHTWRACIDHLPAA